MTEASAKRPYGRSRRDLAEIAIRRFEREGFEATTVEEIAEEAGYSPRTFFRQFASKEDVVFFDLPDLLSPLRALLEPDARAPAAWPAVCAIVVENSVRWEQETAGLARRRTRLFHEEPALHRRFLEIVSEWEAVLAQVFAAERGTDAATDGQALLLAMAVVGACRTALRLWLAEPQPPLADRTRTALALLESGFAGTLTG
jgi:AcrR family transcriptional regulator